MYIQCLCFFKKTQTNQSEHLFKTQPQFSLSKIMSVTFNRFIKPLNIFILCSVILFIYYWMDVYIIAINITSNFHLPYIQQINELLIFQIGFNKCGTTTLADLFEANGIRSMHFTWKLSGRDKDLSKKMFDSHLHNRPILWKLNSTYFGDFGVFATNLQDGDILFLNDNYKVGEYRTWYEILDNQYLEYTKLYILNIRNVNEWIKSRYRHNWRDWLTVKARIALNKTYNESIDDIEVLYRWKSLWYKYHCNFLLYFEKHNLMDNLIIFDIDSDPIQKLIDFFKLYGIYLNSSYYGNDNPSTNKGPFRLKQWMKIEKLYSNLSVKFNDNDEYKNEYQRILHQCGFSQNNHPLLFQRL